MAVEPTLELDFAIDGARPDLTPIRFKGTEKVSTLYNFAIDFVSCDANVDLEALLLKPATFTIIRRPESGFFDGLIGGGDIKRVVTGVITRAEDLGQTSTGEFLYRLHIEPQIAKLGMSRQSQIYGSDQDVNVLDVIRREITGSQAQGHTPDTTANLPLDRFDDSKLTGFGGGGSEYPLRDYIVQYRESDLNFVSRLMEHHGIFYYFKPDEQGEIMVLGDADTCFTRLEQFEKLPLRRSSTSHSGNTLSIHSFTGQRQPRVKKVVLHDYNWRKPKDPLMGEADVDPENGHGILFDYGDHFRTGPEGTALANIRAQEQQCRALQWHGAGDHLGFSAGHIFTLDQSQRAEANGEFILLEVTHEGQVPTGNQLGGISTESAGYRNRFIAIPKGANFRPERKAHKPYVGGLITGHVESINSVDERADINEFGQYKVRLPFDQRGVGDGKGSRYIRKAEPYGGAKNSGGTGHQGMHFPLVKDTEVVLSCTNGDPDRPVIVGTVPNDRAKSVVNRENATQNVLRTSSGIRMTFQDGTATDTASGGGPQHSAGPADSAAGGAQHQGDATGKAPQSSPEPAAGGSALASSLVIDPNDPVPDPRESVRGVTSEPSWQMVVPASWEASLPSGKSSGGVFGKGWVDSVYTKRVQSYLRRGAVDMSEPIEKSYYDADPVSSSNGAAFSRNSDKSVPGVFDYTDGDRVEWTTGNKDVIVNGSMRTYVGIGGTNVWDATPLHYRKIWQPEGKSGPYMTTLYESGSTETVTIGGNYTIDLGWTNVAASASAFNFNIDAGIRQSTTVGWTSNLSLGGLANVSKEYIVDFAKAHKSGVTDSQDFFVLERDDQDRMWSYFLTVGGVVAGSFSTVGAIAEAALDEGVNDHSYLTDTHTGFGFLQGAGMGLLSGVTLHAVNELLRKKKEKHKRTQLKMDSSTIKLVNRTKDGSNLTNGVLLTESGNLQLCDQKEICFIIDGNEVMTIKKDSVSIKAKNIYVNNLSVANEAEMKKASVDRGELGKVAKARPQNIKARKNEIMRFVNGAETVTDVAPVDSKNMSRRRR